MLYLPGGAFLFRWPGLHARLIARWCARLRARALLVGYRLAPEPPFPAASDDCYAAYGSLLAAGHDARDIVLADDSAGGNLALLTLQRASGADQPPPAGSVLLSGGAISRSAAAA
jgi:acetyl esterase/lipase